jgi:hypothetical protein
MYGDPHAKKEEMCDTIDIIEIFDYTNQKDKIILKIDVEGKEYDILEKLIKCQIIPNYVNEIYCDWHYKKIKSISKERHNKLIKELKKFGYNLTGTNLDEFK